MYKIKLFLISFLFFFVLAGEFIFADVSPEHKKQQEEESLQRPIEGFYDIQMNIVSNIEFAVMNTGKLFYHEKRRRGTGIWPRGSVNYYIYGGGIWVGSRKRNPKIDPIDSSIIVRDTVWKYEKWDRENPIVNPEGDTIGYRSVQVEEPKRFVEFDSAAGKIMSLSYNPNTAKSTMVPGRISDGDVAIASPADKYRVFFSLDYSSADGGPTSPESAPVWPIWDASSKEDDVLKYDRYFGWYIHNENERNTDRYPRGPSFISGEDIFCTYKDTDLSRYSDLGGETQLRLKGYPQRIQYEQMVYSWGFGDYRDFIFVKYDQINSHSDTLWDVWLAPIFDVDIAFANNPGPGASNDYTCFYGMEGKVSGEAPDTAKEKHNMAYQWSDGDKGEQGRGFGYVGFVFLESPAIIKEYVDINEYTKETLSYPTDSMGFVRRDKRIIFDEITQKDKEVSWYPTSEQLGLVTFRNWPIRDDKTKDDEMYDFIAGREKDGPSEKGDMRYMMATGPFNMRPMDTSRTVVGLILAGTGKGGDADGTDEDLTELIRKTIFAQTVYDNNFRAPMPPDRAVITEWVPLNNGMILKWSDVAEDSDDAYESGLDFMGYKIYRARRLNLDTFDVNIVAGNSQYPAGKGPFGWKEIKSYQISTPFIKSTKPNYGYRVEGSGSRASQYMGIDSLMIVGPVYVGSKDSLNFNAIQVLRIPRGVNMYDPGLLSFAFQVNAKFDKLERAGFYDDTKTYRNRVTGIVHNIDSIDQYETNDPWAKFFAKKAKEDGLNFDDAVLYYDDVNRKKNYIMDSVMLCTLHLNQSLAKINPLFYEYKRIPISKSRVDSFALNPSNAEVWITKDSMVLDTGGKEVKVTFKIIVDTLFCVGTDESTFSKDNLTIGAMILTDKNLRWKNTPWLRDTAHYNMVLDSVYSYISKGWIRIFEAPDFASSKTVKEEVIKPYMKKITNDRTFIDIGDDNEIGSTTGDAYINVTDDIGKTERLFNNVEYHYKVVSFDEGDFLQPTPIKYNEGLKGLSNLETTMPSAERAGSKVKFDIIYQDTGKLGGLFDFNLFAIDEQRVSQMFAGDTIEVEFTPATYSYITEIEHKINKDSSIMYPTPVGFYNTEVKVTNLTKKKLMYKTTTGFEPQLCETRPISTYVDNTMYRISADTVIIDPIAGDSTTLTLGLPDSKYVYPVVNTFFTTGDFKSRNHCYAFTAEPEMYGTIGLSFNAALKQYGGIYRGDSVDMMNTNVSTVVTKLPIRSDWRKDDTTNNFRPLMGSHVANAIPMVTYFNDTMRQDGNIVVTYDKQAYEPVYARYDNGPGAYVVEFTSGGSEEELLITWKRGSNSFTKKFKAKYLTPVIKDEYSYKRPAIERGDLDSVEVRYSNSDILHMELPIQPKAPYDTINGFRYIKMTTPSPDHLPIIGKSADSFLRKFNIYAQGYVNGRNISGTQFKNAFAIDENLKNKYGTEIQYVGTQGRYYLTAYSEDGDTLDFVHTINIAGAKFVAAYLKKGYRGDGESNYVVSYFTPMDMEEDTTKPYAADFVAGNKIKLITGGGVAGFPEKGAKVRFALTNPQAEPLSDDILDQIKVVPNPYVVSHQAQASPYGAKIYFTKLPKECTIDIYTAAGELVTTIQHNETEDVGKTGVRIWDLLTKNSQRIQSQTLLALIKTPDGYMTTKQFSIVVGGFRLIE